MFQVLDLVIHEQGFLIPFDTSLAPKANDSTKAAKAPTVTKNVAAVSYVAVGSVSDMINEINDTERKLFKVLKA